MAPSFYGFGVTPAILVPISLVVIITVRRFIANRQHKLPLPPGPTPLPVLGNILSVKSQEPWLAYTEWRAVYGDLVFIRVLDQKIIIINSQDVGQDLLEKRSRIYSDRPYFATLEPFGWAYNFSFTPYSDLWRLCRRIFQQTFRPESALRFRPLQMRRAHELIINLIDDPQNYNSHFVTFSSSVALSAVYGYEPSPRNDRVIQILEHALDLGSSVMTSEKAVILEKFPFILKLPDFFWGSSIKHDARNSTNMSNKLVEVPFQYAQQRMVDNTFLDQSESSMVTEGLHHLEKQDEVAKPMFKTALMRAASTALVGAYETTTSTLMMFALAMVLYPDIQRRAQMMIDSVTERDRLPTFEDRASLPYIDAILREVLRWNPILPLGVPHATSDVDIYNGYFIPKGATVISNTWAISRDEKRYPTPDLFIPERFLDGSGVLTNDNPAEYTFGQGRRRCPGRHTADASLWSAMVTILATVDITPLKDADGKVINFTPKFSTGLIRHPLPFPCHISARPHIQSEILTELRTAMY